MSNFQEKAGVLEYERDGYRWTQSVREVMVMVPVPKSTRGRDVVCEIGSKRLKVGLKNATPVLEGELGGVAVADDSLWALEDDDKTEGKVIVVTLQKVKAHDTWSAVVKGKDELSVVEAEEIKKKQMLEKFQNEHPGFDFSGAEFSGQIPDDPASFCRPES
eukprot:TRINITY_DN12416_c0_g1_i1.p2 TRINITY_DN12416_c0_g1~~TRINITY_DN12416_c0_g1_i1.p2  ORF type:complete len:161 (-),score=55.31 TRINITY_DN12416_c0_g1_i1:84-566(-)